jgi:hypothetical protein
MKITGYGDKLSAAPGETIKFMVNCELPAYTVEVVRIICGDTNPAGPGVKEKVVKTPVTKTYKGRNYRGWFLRYDSQQSAPGKPGKLFLASDDLADDPGEGEASHHGEVPRSR